MAKNKNVTIKIASDVKDAKNGIDEITSKLNSMEKAIKGNSFTKLATAVTGVNGALSLAVKGFKTAEAS